MRDPKSGAGSGATQNPADGPRGLGFDLGQAETAIIPIIVGDMERLKPMSKEVQEAGLFIKPVYYPAVPKKQDRVRISLRAMLVRKDLEYTLEVPERLGKKRILHGKRKRPTQVQDRAGLSAEA